VGTLSLFLDPVWTLLCYEFCFVVVVGWIFVEYARVGVGFRPVGVGEDEANLAASRHPIIKKHISS